jgi:hypothetical protein
VLRLQRRLNYAGEFSLVLDDKNTHWTECYWPRVTPFLTFV